jgi:uncharacterized protein
MALPAPSDGAIALVTGASSGIGASISHELARRGHRLALVARRSDRLEELARELREAHGVRAHPVRADLESEDGRDAMATELAQLDGEVAILVNNAGFGDADDLVEADRERLLRMVRLNCEALLDLQARYLPGMVSRGEGAVVNVASMAAFQPLPGNAVYAATKAFVLSLSEAAHSELAGTGVSLTAVCPGPVPTEFMDAAGIRDDVAEDTPELIWTAAEDVARAAIEGAAKGKRVVVPGGLLNRAGALGGQHAPRALLLPLARRAWRRAL